MLTGKAKNEFGKWYHSLNETYFLDVLQVNFEQIPFSMQYGVYVNFFDSVGLRIEILMAPIYNTKYAHKFDYTVYTSNDEEHGSTYEFDTRLEAQIKAIEKANEIYNQN